MQRQNITDLSLIELEKFCLELGLKSFKAKQIWEDKNNDTSQRFWYINNFSDKLHDIHFFTDKDYNNKRKPFQYNYVNTDMLFRSVYITRCDVLYRINTIMEYDIMYTYYIIIFNLLL